MIAIVTNDVHDLLTSDWRDIVGTYRRRRIYKPARGSTQQLSAVQDVVERCYRVNGIAHATLVYDTSICSGKNNQMEIGAWLN